MHRIIPALLGMLLLTAISAPGRADEEAVPLFDGQSLHGWTLQDGGPIASGWEVVDGGIHLDTSVGRAGNIVTEDEYGDFELDFDWKIAPQGNSGIKYRVRNFGNRLLGCEFQILDDEAHPKLHGKGSTGALYDVYEPDANKHLNPIDQFNHSRIVVSGNRIEHWLNGHQIVVAYVGSAEWNSRIAESKFSNVEGFGQNRYGKIMLTDHGSEVWYKNLVIKPLPPAEPSWTSYASRTRCHSVRSWLASRRSATRVRGSTLRRFRRCR